MTPLWKERQYALEKVLRYGNGEWTPMYYKPDLRIHTTRVFWMTREITKYLDTLNHSIYSSSVTNELAIYHDDTELILGDILSVDKENFSKSEKNKQEELNIQAIETLSEKYWKLTKHDYKKLLYLDQDKQAIEYFIVAYADKLDAHMEICHEIFAGNTLPIEKLSRFWLDIYPYDYTRNKLLKLIETLSSIFWKPLTDTHPLFSLSQILDFKNAQFHGNRFTEKNIRHKTGYILYDTWKELHFLHWNTREKEYLWKQKEFCKK